MSILEGLSVREEVRGRIAIEAVNILVANLERLNQRPRAKRGGAAKAKKDIEKFAELTAELHDHVNRMNRDSLRPLGMEMPGAGRIDRDTGRRAGGVSILPLEVQLADWNNAAGKAYASLESASQQPPEHWPGKVGAAAVTDAVHGAYRRLTGEELKGKERLRLLAEVFQALGIKAKPEGQDKALRHRQGKKTEK